MRLTSEHNRRLASGEFKRPEVPEGRDPRNERLRADARRKAINGNVTYYFTCNMRELVLYRVGDRPGDEDVEVSAFRLAEMRSSADFPAVRGQIMAGWEAFLDRLDELLAALDAAPPTVTSSDILAVRNAIEAVVDEAEARALRRYETDPDGRDDLRDEATRKFGFNPPLDPRFRAEFVREMRQLLRFGVFVTAQKMLLYRVLAETGPLRDARFRLDRLAVAADSTDPGRVQRTLDDAWGHAIDRSGDFESALTPRPLQALMFVSPAGPDEIDACRVGAVWAGLHRAVESASWAAVTRNLVGFLYEMIVDSTYRHQLGQFYTREDVVDILVGYAVTGPADTVLDPASGGGSFLWAAYQRKRDLGDTHEQALADVWGLEITAFAAELSTISLATADPTAAAAYPRVALTDFFAARPGGPLADLVIPGVVGQVRLPERFDAVVGNPPYISYRRITNQAVILQALADLPQDVTLPQLSGKSDVYVYFLVHATAMLRVGGRLGFVVSSAVLFTDYGVPLVRFLGRHFRIDAVVDSMVERWFPDADTNVVLLLLHRDDDPARRAAHDIRFVRLRRPLRRLVPPVGDPDRRQAVEDLVETLLTADPDEADPRLAVHLVRQGADGGLEFPTGVGAAAAGDPLEDGEEP